MNSVDSAAILDSIELRIRERIDPKLFRLLDNEPDGDALVIREFQPTRPGAAFLRFITVRGGRQIDVETGTDAHFEFLPARRDSAEDFELKILDLAFAVIERGLRETVWRQGDRVVGSKVHFESEHNTYRLSTHHPRRVTFRKRTRDQVTFSPWLASEPSSPGSVS